MVLARAAAAALLLCALCALACAEDRASAGCNVVRQAYSEMGFSSGTVPENETTGKKRTHTRTCIHIEPSARGTNTVTLKQRVTRPG